MSPFENLYILKTYPQYSLTDTHKFEHAQETLESLPERVGGGTE